MSIQAGPGWSHRSSCNWLCQFMEASDGRKRSSKKRSVAGTTQRPRIPFSGGGAYRKGPLDLSAGQWVVRARRGEDSTFGGPWLDGGVKDPVFVVPDDLERSSRPVRL